jgi:hypothetical protein
MESAVLGALMSAATTQHERWTPSHDGHAEVVRALEDVLASSYFCNSKRYLALLRYVVEQSLLGRGNETDGIGVTKMWKLY